MEEKIKIYLPQNVYQILKKDMELFEFFKKDHTLNKNDFLNKLIVNYYESFAENSSKTYDYIKDVFDSLGITEIDGNNATIDIMDFIAKRNFDKEGQKKDVVISMKPTKLSSRAFEYIENFLLKGYSLSGWLRNLLTSYVTLSQDKREQIIFKENFDLIAEALKKNRMIFFSMNSENKVRHIVSPYIIATSKEELFNYLLAQESGNPYSFRISRIQNITIMNKECNLKNEVINVFEKMKQFGPQFSYALDENKPIKVRLTERGKMMYEKMYLHRPSYSLIEGDIYTFECSVNQAIQYFQRFGKHAVIIEPAEVRNTFEAYYKMAYDAYHKESMLNKK